MANINVRGISEKTKEALRVRAAKAGMSLEAYARRALTKASMEHGDEPKPVVLLAEKYFGPQHGVELELPSRATHRQPAEFS
jgi:plasmid stability protein